MKSCRKYHSKIIFFDTLNVTEQQAIREHIDECEHCRAYYDKIMAITASLRKEATQEHIHGEMLTRFIINENFPNEADFDGQKLSAYEVAEVHSHLGVCDACQQQYQEMRSEFDSLETYLMESEIPDLKLGRNQFTTILDHLSSFGQSIAKRWEELQAHQKQKYVFIPAVGLTMLLVLFLLIPLFKGNGSTYARLSLLENTEVSYLTRGSESNLLLSGIAEFNRGNYSSSVEMLEQFISEEAGDPNRTFAEYVCGLAYLFQASSGSDSDKSKYQYINKGIDHLQSVLASNTNPRFQEDANWYIGKAYLMLEEGQNAQKYFQKVKDINGRKAQKAQNILIELEKNLISTK